jgi:hypothetical protein
MSKNCLTCRHQPDWKVLSPHRDRSRGQCRSAGFAFGRRPELHKDGQQVAVRLLWFLPFCREVTNCPLWEDTPQPAEKTPAKPLKFPAGPEPSKADCPY